MEEMDITGGDNCELFVEPLMARFALCKRRLIFDDP